MILVDWKFVLLHHEVENGLGFGLLIELECFSVEGF